MSTHSELLQEAAAETYRQIDEDLRGQTGKNRCILGYIRTNLFERHLDVNQARKACRARDHNTSGEFRDAVGVTIKQYIDRHRLQTARRLLVSTELRVWQIAQLTGYSRTSVFSNSFVRLIGCRPTTYRQSQHGAAAEGDAKPVAHTKVSTTVEADTRFPPDDSPKMPHFVLALCPVTDRDRCGRCSMPFEPGEAMRMLFDRRPLCDLCAVEHGPRTLAVLLINAARLQRLESEAYLHRLASPDLVEGALRSQLDQEQANHLIWALLQIYPQSTPVVAEVLRAQGHDLELGKKTTATASGPQLGAKPAGHAELQELAAFLKASESERPRAQTLWQELRGLDGGERRQRIRKFRPRFRTHALYALLLQESREVVKDDPPLAQRLARLAIDAIDRVESGLIDGAQLGDARADAWAWLGNAQRAGNDFRAAQKSLEKAMAFYSQGTRDQLLLARLFDYRASLRRDQRRFDEALALIERAKDIYRLRRDAFSFALALIKTATIHHQAGHPELGIPLTREALVYLSGDSYNDLKLAAYHNLMDSLCDSRQYEEALELVPLVERLFERTGQRLDRAKLWWVVGKIHHGLGNEGQAEKRLIAAARWFTEIGNIYDAALVDLDLAGLYLTQERLEELKSLASRLMQVFDTGALHREALTAMQLLSEDSLSKRVATGLLRKLRTYFVKVKNSPRLHVNRADRSASRD